jgi:hypothetical protein
VALLAVSKSKSVELQFIVGEALCILGSGYLCPASKDEYSAILRLNQDESGMLREVACSRAWIESGCGKCYDCLLTYINV